MQPSVDATIRELRNAVNAENDAELARKLRIDKSTVSSWRSRGRVPKRFIEIMEKRELPSGKRMQPPGVWSELQERTLALAMMRCSLMNSELVKSGDTDAVILEYRNTIRFWVMLHRATIEIQARQVVLNVDTPTAELLLMQDDLRDPEATAIRVRRELEEDFADSPEIRDLA